MKIIIDIIWIFELWSVALKDYYKGRKGQRDRLRHPQYNGQKILHPPRTEAQLLYQRNLTITTTLRPPSSKDSLFLISIQTQVNEWT